MGNVLPMPAELEQDERTAKEWVEDQGLEFVEKKPTVTNVFWFRKYDLKREEWDLSVAKTCITFSTKASRHISTGRVIVGLGILDGDTVLLIRPAADNDKCAYKVRTRGGSASLVNPQLIERITERGLTLGEYRLSKTPKGDLVARPIRGGGK